MKNKIFLKQIKAMLLIMLLLQLGCSDIQEHKEAIEVKQENIKTDTITVKGMTCVGCEVSLEKSILKIKGITKAKASASQNNLFLQYDKTKTNKEEIVKAINHAGYTTKE